MLCKWEGTDELIEREAVMDVVLREDAKAHTCAYAQKQMRCKEMELLARPQGFFKWNRLTQLSHQSENQRAFTAVSTYSAKIWDEVSKFRD